MYLVKINRFTHVIRKNGQTTLCGASLPQQSMMVEPYRDCVTCSQCRQKVAEEMIETHPVMPTQWRETIQRYHSNNY